MPAVMSARGEELMEMLPGYYEGNVHMEAVQHVIGAELERVEAFLNDVVLGFFPGRATDTYGMLSLWEVIFGLPVKPAGATGVQRQAALKSAIRARRVGRGVDWEAAVSLNLGTTGWDYVENAPTVYHITVFMPYEEGSYGAGVVRALLRRITPAHIALDFGYGAGFLVGISAVGDVI